MPGICFRLAIVCMLHKQVPAARVHSRKPSRGLAAFGVGRRRVDPLITDEPEKGHEHPLSALAFSPDGTVLFAGDATGAVRVYKLANIGTQPLRAQPSDTAHRSDAVCSLSMPAKLPFWLILFPNRLCHARCCCGPSHHAFCPRNHDVVPFAQGDALRRAVASERGLLIGTAAPNGREG